jgi:hypothetical protein
LGIQTNEYWLRRYKERHNGGALYTKRREDDKRFFNRPRFRIEHDENRYPSIYAPARTYLPLDISRKYLRIHIRNKGKTVAQNCKASLIVIRSYPKQQQYPAIEDVQLAWEGSSNEVNVNTTIAREIQPDERALLHVIFSDSSFPNIPVKPPTPIHAVISSKETLDTSFQPRIIEHGFVIGDFNIEITTHSDNTKAHKCYFRVHVGEQWDMLSMKRMTWFEVSRLRLRSW